MKSDLLKEVSSADGIISYFFALNSIYDGLFIFTLLLAFITVLTTAIYSWSRDLIESLQYGLFVGSLLGFFMILVRQDGVSLINGFQFSTLLGLLVLVSVYKKVTD